MQLSQPAPAGSGTQILPSFGQSAPSPTLCAQVAAAQTRHMLFPAPVADEWVTVVVAVSGGADSVCLLHTLCHFAQRWRLVLHVAHLDHGLRATATADATFVEQLAHAWSLPYHGRRIAFGALQAQEGNLEAAARAARYAFLTEIAQQVTPATQEPIIALAHHADDQAETVLLHLMRGSGLQGLGGMQPVMRRPLHELLGATPQPFTVAEKQSQHLRVVRPFLHIRRTEILQSLRASGLAWREDESNGDERLARNFLRHQIMPKLAQLNPQVVTAIGRLAELATVDGVRLAALDHAALRALLLTPLTTPIERMVLDLTQLRSLPAATQQGVLRQALLSFAPLADLSLHHVERLVTQLQQPIAASGPHPLVGDVAWSSTGAQATTPARLSLHRLAVLPFAPDHPYLADRWRAAVGTATVDMTSPLRVNDDWQLVSRQRLRAALPADWQTNAQPWRAYLDAAQIGALCLTTAQSGQSFTPLGMAGQHKQLGDFFTDRKVHPTLRSGWPLLVDRTSERIRWVCGLAIDHHARITAATTTVLELSWERTHGR